MRAQKSSSMKPLPPATPTSKSMERKNENPKDTSWSMTLTSVISPSIVVLDKYEHLELFFCRICYFFMIFFFIIILYQLLLRIYTNAENHLIISGPAVRTFFPATWQQIIHQSSCFLTAQRHLVALHSTHVRF